MLRVNGGVPSWAPIGPYVLGTAHGRPNTRVAGKIRAAYWSTWPIARRWRWATRGAGIERWGSVESLEGVVLMWATHGGWAGKALGHVIGQQGKGGEDSKATV